MGKRRQPIEGMPLVQRHSGGLGHNSLARLKYVERTPQNYPHLESRRLMRTDTPEIIEANIYEWTEGVWAEAGRENFQTRWLIWHLGKKGKEDQVGRASDQHGPEKTSARLIEGPQAEWPIKAGMGSCWHPYHALSLAEYCLVWKHRFPHNSLATPFQFFLLVCLSLPDLFILFLLLYNLTH